MLSVEIIHGSVCIKAQTVWFEACNCEYFIFTEDKVFSLSLVISLLFSDIFNICGLGRVIVWLPAIIIKYICIIGFYP